VRVEGDLAEDFLAAERGAAAKLEALARLIEYAGPDDGEFRVGGGRFGVGGPAAGRGALDEVVLEDDGE